MKKYILFINLIVLFFGCQGSEDTKKKTVFKVKDDSLRYGVNFNYDNNGNMVRQFLLSEELDTLYEIIYDNGKIVSEKGETPWIGKVWCTIGKDSILYGHSEYHFVIPDSTTSLEIRFMEWVDDTNRYTTHVKLISKKGGDTYKTNCETKLLNDEPLLRSVARYFRENKKTGEIDTTIHSSDLVKIETENNFFDY